MSRRSDGIDAEGDTWTDATRSIFRGPDTPLLVDDHPADRKPPVEPRLPSSGLVKAVPMRRRRNRMVRTNSARVAMAEFLEAVADEPDEQLYLFLRSTGEFSLLDTILVLLDLAGPSAVTVETWSASLYDMEVLNRFISSDLIRSFRLVLDVSFKNNAGNSTKDGLAYSSVLEDVFGLDAIRTTKTHAKAATITGGDHHFAVLPSANLNENMRAERFTITNARGHVAWEVAVVDELFDGIDPGWHPDRGADQLQRFDTTGNAVGAQPMGGLGAMTL